MCDWNMILAVIGVNVTVLAIITGFIIWGFSKLDSDIKSLSEKMDADTHLHIKRTDQLYQMFIDLLKEKRERTDP